MEHETAANKIHCQCTDRRRIIFVNMWYQIIVRCDMNYHGNMPGKCECPLAVQEVFSRGSLEKLLYTPRFFSSCRPIWVRPFKSQADNLLDLIQSKLRYRSIRPILFPLQFISLNTKRDTTINIQMHINSYNFEIDLFLRIDVF